MLSLVLSVAVVSAPAPLPKREPPRREWPVGVWMTRSDDNLLVHPVIEFKVDGSYREETSDAVYVGSWTRLSDTTVRVECRKKSSPINYCYKYRRGDTSLELYYYSSGYRRVR